MTGRKKRKVSCYICAASNSGLETLQAILIQLNVRSSKVADISPSGYSLPGVILRQMQEVDFVCGVVEHEERSASNVLFELGIAVGLSKPVFIIGSLGVVLPLSLQAFPHVRASPSDTEAIRFHLSAFIENMKSVTTAVLQQPTRIRSQWRRTSDKTDQPLVADNLYDVTESELVKIVTQAFRSVNASVTVDAKIGNSMRADIVAWLDDPTANFGGPILIEVKRTENKQAVEVGVNHARKYIETAHVRTALLIVTADQPNIDVRPFTGGFVFVLSVRLFLNLLRDGDLTQQLVEARNRFAHSVG